MPGVVNDSSRSDFLVLWQGSSDGVRTLLIVYHISGTYTRGLRRRHGWPPVAGSRDAQNDISLVAKEGGQTDSNASSR